MSITVTSMSSTVSSIRALSSAGTSAGMSSGGASAAAAPAYSSDAAIVATFGGSSSSPLQVYDGSGLLSRIRQIQAAGDAAASAYLSANSAPTSAATSAATSAPTSATGTSTTGPDVTANWASILKTRPELAGVAIGYAFDQGIVNTLSTYA